MSARLEQRALTLLAGGRDVHTVADLTTVPVRRVVELRNGAGVVCELDWCGHSQTGPGRPRKGSIRVATAAAASAALWFCSWGCVAAHAHGQAAQR